MKNTTFVGSVGEQIAADYLLNKGYRILERNAKICGSEIDIICEALISEDGSIVSADKNKTSFKFLSKLKKHTKSNDTFKANRVVVFCEVKTRSDNVFGSGAEAVTPYKIGRYITAAKFYISTLNNVNTDVRFDVIEVGEGGINHIIGAFCENDAKYSRK